MTPNQGITYEFLDADDNTLEDSSPVGGDFQVNVVGGKNVIKMKLTAEDGTTTQTTTLTVTRVARPPIPFAPTDFSVAPGNGEVALAWAAPASGVTRHEYRYKTDREISRDLDGYSRQRAGRELRLGLHGDPAHLRNGVHLPGARGE